MQELKSRLPGTIESLARTIQAEMPKIPEKAKTETAEPVVIDGVKIEFIDVEPTHEEPDHDKVLCYVCKHIGFCLSTVSSEEAIAALISNPDALAAMLSSR